jgi:uncharacterized membrane protein HdeD (DUF308 family)
MILVLFRIHAVAAGLVFLALAVNAASQRDRRAWFWMAAASAYGCAVAITFAHFVAAMAGAVVLATSVVVHTVVQRAASISSNSARAALRRRRSLERSRSGRVSPASTASRRAKADRFSNTG